LPYKPASKHPAARKKYPDPELVKLATFRIHQVICLSEKFLDCLSELA
jgi:hypothetical protein